MPTPAPQTVPPLPQPRTDLEPPKGETPEGYAEWLASLAEEPVDAWRDQDGMIYLLRMPASMAPNVGLVDSATYVPPDSPSYQDWLNRVAPEYDFMLPTKVTPQPRKLKEATSGAQNPDRNAQA